MLTQVAKLIVTTPLCIFTFLFAVTSLEAQMDVTSVQKKAESGDAQSQFLLGVLYANGNQVAKDVPMAMKWWTKAAEQGDDRSQQILGARYLKGDGVAQDYALARVWFQKAADQGDSTAQDSLGKIYAKGYGVPQDYALAQAWFKKAAGLGNPYAYLHLGDMYARGLGGPADDALARASYQKAAGLSSANLASDADDWNRLKALKEAQGSIATSHDDSNKDSSDRFSNRTAAPRQTVGQASSIRYDDITGQSWTCRAEQLGPGYGDDGVDTVEITFNDDRSMIQGEYSDRHLHWVFQGNRWAREGATVSWDPDTGYVFRGTVNGDYSKITGGWSNNSSESGPLVCQRPTSRPNPSPSMASNQSPQSSSSPGSRPMPAPRPAPNSNQTMDTQDNQQSALDNNCLVRDPEPWHVGGDKKTVAVLKLRNTCAKPLQISFCFKSPGDQCWKCTQISAGAGKSATSMDLIPGCTTSNCSEVQAIYNVGTQKPNVPDSCVSAMH